MPHINRRCIILDPFGSSIEFSFKGKRVNFHYWAWLQSRKSCELQRGSRKKVQNSWYLVVGQAVYDDEFDAAGLSVVVDDEVFAGVDVLVVVEPADFRHRRSRDHTRQGHLATVGCHHVLQVRSESRRHQLLLRNWYTFTRKFYTLFNPLESTNKLRNYNATSKLVHWPLMSGLLHLVERASARRAWAQATPNVTAHQSTASVYTNHCIAV